MRNLGAVVSSPPKGSQPGAVGQVDRWFETVIAFARLYPCGSETTIAFAGEKRVFLVQCLGAEVMPVSAVPCWGRAVVLLVSTSPCCRASCAKKVRPAWPDGGREREKVRPARSKHPKIGVLWRAGRVFSRKRGWRGCAGQVCGPAVVGSHRASFDATRSRTGPSIGGVNPSIRSYAHLVVAGRGRPPLAPATLPATQSVDKGKVPSGQGRDKP